MGISKSIQCTDIPGVDIGFARWTQRNPLRCDTYNSCVSDMPADYAVCLGGGYSATVAEPEDGAPEGDVGSEEVVESEIVAGPGTVDAFAATGLLPLREA